MAAIPELTCRRNDMNHSISQLPGRTVVTLFATTLYAFIFCCLALSMTCAQAVSFDEVGTGELLFKGTGQRDWNPAPQLGTKVNIQVSGLVARVTVEQQFRNPGTEWSEARYVFPLPETAAVNDMRIRIGERVIIGEIHEKKIARKIYQQAKKNGQRTALVEQRRPNMFATNVANIGPNQTVSVTLTYLQKVAFDHGRFSLRFPMTITPRYIPGQSLDSEHTEPFSAGVARTVILHTDLTSGWAAPTSKVADAHEITPYQHPQAATPAHPMNEALITVTIDPGLPLANIDSPWHDIQIDRQGNEYRIELANGPIAMDRDFELSWQPVASTTPQAAVFTEDVAGETYALVMVVPPAQPGIDLRLNREAIFIIDTSGSMGGEPIRQAKAALLAALDSLQPTDRFNIIEFNDEARRLFSSAQLAAGSYLYDARRFVSDLDSGGGTEMQSALQAALEHQPELARGHLRQIVFITDGAVGNEDELFRLINTQLANSRLFTVGIGAAPNSYFMRKAAQFGRGTFTYIGGQDQVVEKMSELFTQLQTPVMRDIKVNWPGKAMSYPEFIPDLYSGQPLLMTARLDKAPGMLTVSGTGSQAVWRQQVTMNTVAKHTGIATLWAHDRINALNDQIIATSETSLLRQAIIDVALLHKLVSRYTSFVAVEQQPVRPAGSNITAKNVPNVRPHGQIPQSFAYPQTATPAVEKMWLGLLCAVFAGQLWYLRRRALLKKDPASA